MVTIKRVTTAQVRPIRHAVLRVGQPYASTLWAGDDAEGTVHFGAFDADTLVGIASLLLADPATPAVNAQLRLRGMAVLPDQRRKGLGNLLLDGCFAYAQAHQFQGMWCNARVSALAFYEAYGFQTHGDMFEPPLIGPHYMMWKAV